MSTPAIVLVPGFWLGAWAWDDVAAGLRADGHEVNALTLPGRELADTDRSSITLADQVNENLDGLSEEQLETFRERSVPAPGSSLREGPQLNNDARLDIPST